MTIYRVAWLFFCGMLGALGALGAFTWSSGPIIMLFVLGAFTGGVAALVALDPEKTTRLPRERRRMVATGSIVCGAGSVAFVGLGTLLGAPMAVLLLAITAGGSPYAIRYCLRWLREHGHLAEPAPAPAPAGPRERSLGPLARTISAPEPERPAMPHVAPASLGDDELCLAWRASFSALQRANSPAQRMRIVEARRAYLDEIERRNANGMAAWLASGARAAGDPTPFVVGGSAAGRAPIDWDDLLHDTDK